MLLCILFGMLYFAFRKLQKVVWWLELNIDQSFQTFLDIMWSSFTILENIPSSSYFSLCACVYIFGCLIMFWNILQCLFFYLFSLLVNNEYGSHVWFHWQKAYKTTLSLAYQSFGVVYGDLSTSPIYVFTNTFSGRLRLHESDDNIILGVLSLIFWTLTLIPLCKYIIFVLGADDNGEGVSRNP